MALKAAAAASMLRGKRYAILALASAPLLLGLAACSSGHAGISGANSDSGASRAESDSFPKWCSQPVTVTATDLQNLSGSSTATVSNVGKLGAAVAKAQAVLLDTGDVLTVQVPADAPRYVRQQAAAYNRATASAVYSADYGKALGDALVYLDLASSVWRTDCTAGTH